MKQGANEITAPKEVSCVFCCSRVTTLSLIILCCCSFLLILKWKKQTSKQNKKKRKLPRKEWKYYGTQSILLYKKKPSTGMINHQFSSFVLTIMQSVSKQNQTVSRVALYCLSPSSFSRHGLWKLCNYQHDRGRESTVWKCNSLMKILVNHKNLFHLALSEVTISTVLMNTSAWVLVIRNPSGNFIYCGLNTTGPYLRLRYFNLTNLHPVIILY